MLTNKKVKLFGAVLISAVLFVNSLFTWGALYQISDRQDRFEHVIISVLNDIETQLTEVDTPVGLALDPQIHVTMRHYRDGVLIGYSHHAGVLTTAGQDWIEDQLGDSPSVDPAKWIGLSNNSGAPSAAWTEIPDEITTGAMGRAAGTYLSTGIGTWNMTHTFSPTEANSTQLVGIYYAAAGAGLLFSDTITLVNYQNGDSLEIEASHSVT